MENPVNENNQENEMDIELWLEKWLEDPETAKMQLREHTACA